ncbi:NAD(P)/FAD-dependent oxidoreductase [Pararhizobium haloflavum]|uniref:NAD(P)/FAD-dependent oxidoreductase n=1 Tax=Pararhizobium haloflavum TaxID=2037914 RepID=UPI000C1A3650|nr:FAD-binding oxidoreductase [Pararhizobium haloflavum]
MTTYRSPISPGLSWYEDGLAGRPVFDPLDGSRRADVVIVGGGYTGMQAALNLAEAGVDVALIEAARFGDGASGRNGGQIGTGQRADADELEAEYGAERARALFELAEDAKRYLLDCGERYGIDIDYRPGQLSLAHKARYVDDFRRYTDEMRERWNYPHVSFMDREETAWRVGSRRFFAGVRDTGTGHIHPMKLMVGLARAAAAAGAGLFEGTRAEKIEAGNGKVIVTTRSGTITAKHGLIACNAHIDGLEPVTAAHVMPIRSFIGATVPVEDASILPGGEAVDDSRFVVRYFRKTADGRLLFGGREAYTSENPKDISTHIRKQIAEIYPSLHDIELTHAWGGSVAITLPRKPFVREVMPGVISIGGFSGHGVKLSNYCGKLYADTILGDRTRLALFEQLKVPPFPGGTKLRAPLLFLALTWFALRDRI